MLFIKIDPVQAPFLASLRLGPYRCEGRTLADGTIIMDVNDMDNPDFLPVRHILAGFDTIELDPADLDPIEEPLE